MTLSGKTQLCWKAISLLINDNRTYSLHTEGNPTSQLKNNDHISGLSNILYLKAHNII